MPLCVKTCFINEFLAQSMGSQSQDTDLSNWSELKLFESYDSLLFVFLCISTTKRNIWHKDLNNYE